MSRHLSRRRTSIVLLIVALLAATPLLGVPAQAGPASGPDPTAAGLPLALEPLADEPVDVWGSVIDEHGFHPEVLQTHLKQQIARAGGPSMPSLRQEVSVGHDAVPNLLGASLLGFPAGELDGDGRADTFVLGIDLATFDSGNDTVEIGLAAHSGTGDVLWNRSLDRSNDLPAMALFDVDGDGHNDPLVFSFEATTPSYDEDCLLVLCWYDHSSRYLTNVTAIDGASGSDLWTHTIISDILSSSSSANVGAVPVWHRDVGYQITNLTWSVHDVGNADAIGGTELAISTYDLIYEHQDTTASAFVAVVDRDSTSYGYEPGFRTLAGTTGAILHDQTLPRQQLSPPVIAPLGDADGDGVSEMTYAGTVDDGYQQVCAWPHHCLQPAVEPVFVVSALDVLTGLPKGLHTEVEPAIETRARGHAYDDVNGDGIGDLVYRIDDHQLDTSQLWLRDGRTGQVQWHTTAVMDRLAPAIDADGDGLLDVLLHTLYHHQDDFQASAWNGTTGDLIGLHTIPLDQDDDVDVLSTGDADGDGTTDLYLLVRTNGATTLQSVSLGHGPLAERALPSGIYFAASLADELLISGVDVSYPGKAEEAFAQRLDGATLQPVWTLGALQDEPLMLAFQLTGSADAGDSTDAVVSALAYETDGNDITIHSHLRVVDGTTSQTLWELGGPLPDYTPPPVTPQGDAGSGTDAANDAADAFSVALGTWNGTLLPDEEDPVDVYAVTLAESGVLRATREGDERASVALYDASGTRLSHGSPAQAVVEAGETAFVRISTSSYHNDDIAYKITAERRDPTPQDDGGSGGDAGDERETAVATQATDYSGLLVVSEGDRTDWYSYTATDDGTARFRVSQDHDDSWSYVQLSNGTGDLVYGTSVRGDRVGDVQMDVATGETLYLRIHNDRTDTNYTVQRLGPEAPAAGDDAGLGHDASDDASSADPLDAGSYNGSLGADDDADWYAFDLSAGQTLELDMTPYTGDFDLELERNGTSLGGSYRGGTSTEDISYTANVDQEVQIGVIRFSGDGDYELTIAVEEPTPPEPVEPHTASFNATGSITCAASTGVIHSNDLCDGVSGGDPQTFAFPAEIGLTGLHIELRWDDAAPTATERMTVAVQKPVDLEWTEGESTLVVDHAFERNDDLDEIVVHVRIGEDQGLAVEQDFELCVTAMYGDVELPAGFRCLAD